MLSKLVMRTWIRWQTNDPEQDLIPDLLFNDTETAALEAQLLGLPPESTPVATQQSVVREQSVAQPVAISQLELPSIRRTPLNEFNRSQALFSLAFPTLYPDGQADFVEPRLRSITYQDYIEHAMRTQDGRFARHPTWRFVAFNTLMRRQARSHSGFFAVQQSKLGGRELTHEDVREAFKNPDSDEAQRLITSIARHSVQLRGTRPFWNRRRQDLEAYAHNLRCPGAFLTFSPADLHWSSLYQHMPGFVEWSEAPEPQRMAISARLLRENPHIAAWHFHRRFTLFRDIVLKSKFNLTDYWTRYEWQKRGSPHSHGLYWMEGAPLADMDNEDARREFARL